MSTDDRELEGVKPVPLPLVDASDGDFYGQGSGFVATFGVLGALDSDLGGPAYSDETGDDFVFDPRALRAHDLRQKTRSGARDRRLAPQVLNDFYAELAPPRPGDVPYGQPEFWTPLNRTTRIADSEGRVALWSSQSRITDSEDARYAHALAQRGPVLGSSQADAPPATVENVPLPEGVHFNEAGTQAGGVGTVTRSAPSVSVGGVTWFQPAAIAAAKAAAAAGGTAADIARAAAAGAAGRQPPPLDDGDTHERAPAPPPPDRNPAGSYPASDHPLGYLWDEPSGRVGLLGTVFAPGGVAGSYFTGREGTRIGPLPIRHDALFSMGPDTVGRLYLAANDASQVPRGRGRPIKGELWHDRSRANIDT